MISREQAQGIINAAKLENPNQILAARINTLPTDLAQKTFDYLAMDSSGKDLEWSDWEKRSKFDEAASEAFAAISEAKFEQVLETWFPQFAPVVLRALRLPSSNNFGFQVSASTKLLDGAGPAKNWLGYVKEYDQPLAWFAEHAAHNWQWSAYLVPMYVAAINAGDSNMLKMFMLAAKNEHPVMAMGDHVIRVLLQANNPDGWELIEKLLLAAQRQEGLRQSIFSAISSAHPTALRRMLNLILEHDLMRFSSSVGWAQVFLPLLPPEPTPKVLETSLKALIALLEHQEANRQLAQNTKDIPDLKTLYLSLHSLAMNDLKEAQTLASGWLKDSKPELRFLALHMLFTTLGLYNSVQESLLEILQDPDDRVVLKVLYHVQYFYGSKEPNVPFVKILETLLTRFPENVEVEAPEHWMGKVGIKTSEIVNLMHQYTGEDNLLELLKYRAKMNTYTLGNLITSLTKTTTWDAEVRVLVADALAGKEDYAREKAFAALKTSNTPLEETSFAPLEKLLSRKNAELRKNIIQLILRQDHTVAISSANRLKTAKTPEQRKAGDEILRMLEKKQSTENQPSATDGFGLFDPKLRTPAFPLENKKIVLVTDAAKRCLESLTALVNSHMQTVISIENWEGVTEELPFINAHNTSVNSTRELTPEEQWKAYPLHDVWEAWFANRKANERDKDGLELLRVSILIELRGRAENAYYKQYNRRASALKAIYDNEIASIDVKTLVKEIPWQVNIILSFLQQSHGTSAAHDFALDVLEHQLAIGIPALDLEHQQLLALPTPETEEDKQKNLDLWQVLQSSDERSVVVAAPAAGRELRHDLREFQLLHTWQILTPWRVERPLWNLELGLKAWKNGVANQTDIWDYLIGQKSWRENIKETRAGFADLTTRKPSAFYKDYPELQTMVESCVSRVLELELQRGDLPTPVSAAAARIQSLVGVDRLLQLLNALGKDNLVRGSGYYYGEIPRNDLFSRLIKAVQPALTDTPESFVKAVKAAKIPEQRLLELGLFAPQWVRFVEKALAWKGAGEAMYWLHAHTKENGWSSNNTELEGWKAEMSELTPLTTQDLLDGAVDVGWFARVYKTLGADRWTRLYDAAKYTCSGIGHARAKQFADAMLGKLEETAVIARVTEKRHQDSVRALGLIPLSKSKDTVLLKRYEVVQKFLKESKQFGSQRRESEALAARIGMENLARTAGFSDPMRLEWAMELKSISDLAKGAVKVKKADTEFVLSVNETGEPELEILKAGKPLKAIPAAHKKDEAVLELQARKKALLVQTSRMRVSLERAMVHGDAFSAKELRDLTKHPLLRPMLEQLVFTGDKVFGFLSHDGKNLVSMHGELLEIPSFELRLAHPVDLLETGNWSEWQSAYFASNRKQPFKQIFRELYLLTEAEKLEKTKSSRYTGHQVNQNQSRALLGARAWVSPFDDDARRTFFKEGITAFVSSKHGYTTSAEVEAPAIDTVRFTKRGEWESLKLEDISAHLFSEVMRDLDLMVSVAHVGGVDPEASQSTTEMRAVLLRETCRLLKISNVQIVGSVATIQGQIGKYSVHLGSAVVHQQPGGSVCIVAVPNQARGRIFLPFADSDPRSAEVIAKVLLLAKDSEIQDPVILRQLVG